MRRVWFWWPQPLDIQPTSARCGRRPNRVPSFLSLTKVVNQNILLGKTWNRANMHRLSLFFARTLLEYQYTMLTLTLLAHLIIYSPFSENNYIDCNWPLLHLPLDAWPHPIVTASHTVWTLLLFRDGVHAIRQCKFIKEARISGTDFPNIALLSEQMISDSVACSRKDYRHIHGAPIRCQCIPKYIEVAVGPDGFTLSAFNELLLQCMK